MGVEGKGSGRAGQGRAGLGQAYNQRPSTERRKNHTQRRTSVCSEKGALPSYLDVAVDDALGVHVVQRTQEGVQHELYCLALRQPPAVLVHYGEQVGAVDVLLHHDHLVALLEGRVHRDDVLVLHTAVQVHLEKGG